MKQRGLTLVELMVVLAVIAIISALAIPSLLDARMSSNEASAISSLRVLCTVSEQYRVRFGVYPADLTALASGNYIDDSLGSGKKAGYDFFFAGNPITWLCFANPEVHQSTGNRFFYSDVDGVIYFDPDGVANPSTSAPVD